MRLLLAITFGLALAVIPSTGPPHHDSLTTLSSVNAQHTVNVAPSAPLALFALDVGMLPAPLDEADLIAPCDPGYIPDEAVPNCGGLASPVVMSDHFYKRGLEAVCADKRARYEDGERAST